MNVFLNTIKILCLGLALCCPSTSFGAWNAETITINFPIDDDPASPINAVAKKVKELSIQRLGEHIIKVNLYPASGKDLFLEMEQGYAQMIAPSLPSLKRYSTRMQVFELPFLFYSAKAAENFLDGEWGIRLLDSLSLTGISAHGYIHRGMKHLTSNIEIKKPSDLALLKLAISESNTAQQHYQSLGVEVINLNKTQIPQALLSKKVDATENNWENIFFQKLSEQQSFILETGHAYSGNVVISKESIWKQIPPELQPVLKNIIKDAISYGNQQAKKLNQSLRKNIIESGAVTIAELSVGERYEWIAAAQEVWKSYENEIGVNLIREASTFR